MLNIETGDLATWRVYVPRDGKWETRNGRVTRKLGPETWEVCGNFGVRFIDPIACEIQKLESE